MYEDLVNVIESSSIYFFFAKSEKFKPIRMGESNRI